MAKNKKEKPAWLDRVIRGHLYLLVILLPLAFWLETQTIFTLPKLLLLRTVSLSAVLFILYKFFRARTIRLVIPVKMIFLGLWLFSVIISTIFSINPLTSIFGQYGRFLGVLTYLNMALIPLYIVNFFETGDLRRLLRVSAYTSIVVALYGLLQYFDFFGLWAAPFTWTDSPQSRVFSTMGHANHLAAYLAAHFLIIGYGFEGAAGRAKLLVTIGKILAMGLLAWVLVLTASRGAVLALVAAAIVLVLLKSWKTWPSLKKKAGKIVLTVVIFALLLVPGLLMLNQHMNDLSLVKRTEQTIASLEMGNTPERLSFLYSALAMFRDNPLIGTGFATFRDAYSAYRRADYTISGLGNAQYITVPESAHNEYVNIMATQGLLGILTYLALVIVLFISLLRQYLSAGKSAEGYYLAVLGVLLVFVFQTVFNFAEIVNCFLFFLVMGLVFAEEKNKAEYRCVLPKFAWYPLILLVFFLVIFAFREMVFSKGQADFYYRQARLANAREKNVLADQYYQVAIAAQPLEYQLHQAYGDFSMAAAYAAIDPNSTKSTKTYLLQATREYEHALSLNPNYPSTYHNMALAYLQLYRLTGNLSYQARSRENYLLSIEKSPNNPRYLYEYARKLHSDWDDNLEAVRLLRQAIVMAPDYQEPRDYLDFLYKNHPELANMQ